MTEMKQKKSSMVIDTLRDDGGHNPLSRGVWPVGTGVVTEWHSIDRKAYELSTATSVEDHMFP
jgi:hypothetical protein